MNKWLRSQLGFTLAEVLVSVGLLTIATSIIGTSMFQALATQRVVQDDGHAIDELRKGLGWFAEGIKMAHTADVTGGVLTLTWTDHFNDADQDYTVTYAKAGNLLVRTLFVGTTTNALAVVRRVASVSFSISGQTVSAQVEVDSKPQKTRTLSATAVMRPTS